MSDVGTVVTGASGETAPPFHFVILDEKPFFLETAWNVELLGNMSIFDVTDLYTNMCCA